MTGLEVALRHAFNERDEEIAKLRAEIVSLTEQRDEWRLKWARVIEQRDANRREAQAELEAIGKERDAVTEQRDRTMKVVEAAREMVAMPGLRYLKGLPDADPYKGPGNRLADALAALDAEAAAETAPSLPETP